MSSISAGTSTGTALVSTGDTTGALVFKTGASATTAMTIGADQSVVFAGTVSGGLPGSGGTTASGSVVLTSASAGAQSITTTAYGQSVTLPDATTLGKSACVYNINNLGSYPLKIVNAAGTTKGFVSAFTSVTIGLADNSTSAGTWVLSGASLFGVSAWVNFTASSSASLASNILSYNIDTTRNLHLIFSASNIYGIIYNSSTNAWGSGTLIRTGSSTAVAIKTTTDQFLITSINSTTGFQAVVLTLSGTSITVGTAATATLAGNVANFDIPSYPTTTLIAVGTSWAVTYARATSVVGVRALTISGTTVTIGSETIVTGDTRPARLYAVSSSVLLAISNSNTALIATPITVSGSTLTTGTLATTTATAGVVRTFAMTSRWAVVYSNTNIFGAVISVTGTTATISATTLIATTLSNVSFYASATKIAFTGDNASTCYFNTFSDNSGTISAGTAINYNAGSVLNGTMIYPETSTSLYWYIGSAQSPIFSVDISATSPVAIVKGSFDRTAAANGPLISISDLYGLGGEIRNIKSNSFVTNVGMNSAEMASPAYVGFAIFNFAGQITVSPPFAPNMVSTQAINSGALLIGKGSANLSVAPASFPIVYLEAAQ